MDNSFTIFPIKTDSFVRLAIVSRPRANEGLDESIEYLQSQNYHALVSALTDEEQRELGLSLEEITCKKYNIEFFRFPIQDRGIPESFHSVFQFSRKISERIKDGRAIGFHCRAGIGRSSLLVASFLISLGNKPKEILEKIRESRKLSVPDTLEQEQWIYNFYQYVVEKKKEAAIF